MIQKKIHEKIIKDSYCNMATIALKYTRKADYLPFTQTIFYHAKTRTKTHIHKQLNKNTRKNEKINKRKK